ncbi:MAG: plasmid pRiA4b family protein [Segetibacter sp.]|nr:plasmid pRiA4b family protein [Segetibacter sp.]
MPLQFITSLKKLIKPAPTEVKKNAFRFKIVLQDVDNPAVWRRVMVPANFTFYHFHLVIQEAFGWENCHMFQFSPKGYGSKPAIGMPGGDRKTVNSKQKKLSEIFSKPDQKFIYLYDFGDGWTHEITVEEITEEELAEADCIAGEGACPPEDCGGTVGYEHLKMVLSDPKDPEYKETREWLGLSNKKKWDQQHST